MVRELVRPFEKVRVGYTSTCVEDYEFPALGLLQDACRTWSGHVFYLHGKGASRSPLDQHGRYWRALMLDEVVRNHATCTALLRDHDIAGTNWKWNHYSGNFWWARADYVRRLPDIRALRRTPRFITSDPVWNFRLQCEFWVGMGRGRAANLGVSGLDLDRSFRWSVDAADVVNQLLAALGGDRYAEIVIGGPSIYLDRVHAESKDSFGDGARPPDGAAYDVVLVDGWHDEDSCFADIEVALANLRGHGAVVVHDTNPPTAWHEREPAGYEPGSEWNGQAWRAVRRFARERPTVWVRTVDTDWGCTVILPWLTDRARPRVDGEDDGSGWEWFERHRDEVLRLVAPSQFLRLLYAIPFARGDARARGESLDHMLLYGPPGLGKTSLAHIIAREMGVNIRSTVGPGDRAPRRPGGAAHQPRGRRRAVHRRDPPPQPRRRGDPLSGDGGLPDRRHDRAGAVGALDQARPQALHAHRRDDARRPADLAAARPLRRQLAARLLQRRGAGRDRAPLGAHPRRADRDRAAPTRSRAARAARRASPTACCAACATSPRCAPRASSPARWPTRRWRCSRSTSAASTRWTAPSC